MPENFEDGTYEIIGCAMQVHQSLGPSLREKPYENALAVALRKKGISHRQQSPYPIEYENTVVGECIPDLSVGSTIVEVKAIDHIGANEVGQMLNYLRISGKSVGLVLNFKNVKLDWKRVVL